MPGFRRASSANTKRTARRMPDDARTLIVTGASSGIGRALALAAARDGYRVVARRAPRRAARRAARPRFATTAGRASYVAGDVTARRHAGAHRRRPRCTHSDASTSLVNNAGGGTYGALLRRERRGDRSAVAAQRRRAACGSRARRSRSSKRRAVSWSSSVPGARAIPLPNYGAYAPAKAAIRAAAIQLRRELRTRGIAVTYVDPGFVATEFHSSYRHRARAADSRRIAGSRRARDSARHRHGARAVVNGVPWQTAGSALGEWLGTLADPLVVARFTPRTTLRSKLSRVALSFPKSNAEQSASKHV